MAHLFEPFTCRGVTLRNRIGVAPMCQYWAEDGMFSDWHLVHLGSRAVGGAGLVITEATAITAEARITSYCTGIWSDAQVEPLVRITDAIREYGAVPGIQINHAGRKASTTPPWHADGPRPLRPDEGAWETIAASPLPYGQGWPLPREMDQGDIDDTLEAYARAAARADEAGFDWLEVHAAHGYLPHNFYSPISNKRTDAYGGSGDNRMRFACEVARAIREVWPNDKVLAFKISAVDWLEGGWELADSVALARRLKQAGVDLIDCSSGNVTREVRLAIEPGWQVPFAETVRREAGIATAAVGAITEPRAADAVVRADQADIVLLATEMLRNPYWPYRAAHELDQLSRLKLPTPYNYVINRHYVE